MKIIITAVAAMTVLAASSASAQSAPVAKVFYGDLNIDSTAGMTTLKSRIAHAARSLCDTDVNSTDVGTHNAGKACYRAAVTGAMKQLPDHAPQFASR